MKNDKYQTLIQPRLGEIAAYLNAGNPPAKAAEYLGIADSTLRRYRKNYRELDELFRNSDSLCDDLVEAALLRRATGYEDSSGKEIAPDVRAAVFWLQNRRPKRWKGAEKEKKTVTNNKVKVVLSKTEAEL